MQLTFSSIEELKEFVKSLKGTRGAGKGGDGDGDGQAGTGQIATQTAPAPMQPPATGFNPVAAGAPGPFAGPPAGASPFAAPQPAGDPVVAALVSRITARVDALAAAGQATDQMLAWFRQQCGPDAAAATMDQIKTVFLSRLPASALENIAKVSGS